MPMHHHRHESQKQKRAKAQMRIARHHANEIRSERTDAPSPLIDIGIDRISELIKSVTGNLGDAYQDAWLQILEHNISDPIQMMQIAKTCHRRLSNLAITEKHDIMRLDNAPPVGNMHGAIASDPIQDGIDLLSCNNTTTQTSQLTSEHHPRLTIQDVLMSARPDTSLFEIRNGRPRTGELRQCISCGKTIYVRQSRIAKGYPGLHCQQCDRQIHPPPTIIKHGIKTASRTCLVNHQFLTKGNERICIQCGEIRKAARKVRGNPIILKKYAEKWTP